MNKVPETFIKAHLAICHRKGIKRHPYTPVSKYYGKRKLHTLAESSRQRACAKKLYAGCLKLGIKPTPIREDFIKEYDRIKGIKL